MGHSKVRLPSGLAGQCVRTCLACATPHPQHACKICDARLHAYLLAALVYPRTQLEGLRQEFRDCKFKVQICRGCWLAA